jgi:hypothetical protein
MHNKTPFLALLAFLATVAVALAEGRWFELRVSPTHPMTNYAIPAGKVFSIMSFDSPNGSASFTAVRPEGTISAAALSQEASEGSFIVGPGTVTLNWSGQVNPAIGFHLLTCREFDADPLPVAPVVVRLEASTNLPSFGPASVLFRAKSENP